MGHIHLNRIVISIVSFLALAFPAFAVQNAQAQETRANQKRRALEEITVTARKREESLQDTPISITAFTGVNLEARGITTIDRIQNATPNLTFYSYTPFGGSSNNATVYLRGIGQSDFAPTTEPGVGLYVDGVYYGRSIGSVLSLIGIERVEVLRGPQGTLFGRNTTGGAISITSIKPHDGFGVTADLTVGSYDRFDAKSSINVPISDTLYGLISVGTFNQDGYVKHVRTGQDFGDDDTVAGRAALRWEPSDRLTADLAFDYSRDRENGPATVYSGAVYLDPSLVPPTGNFPYTNNVVLGFLTGCDGTPANPAGSLDNPACINDQYLGQKNGDPDAYFSNNENWGVSLGVDWSLNEYLQLRSITAYRDLDAHFAYEGDDTPILLTATEDLLTQHQFTQEFQLLGTALEDRLDWILGFFYFHEDGRNPNTVTLLPVTILSGGEYDNESVAGFAQATWNIADRWHVTAGLRYTEDTKRFLPQQKVLEDRSGGFFPPGTPLLPSVEAKNDANDTTPMVNLAYDWSDDLMLYATYSEGFKGGGFHQRVFPPLPEVPQFDPERVDSYEVGFKYASPARRFVLNGAGFHSRYRDLQVTVFTSVAPVLDNAGDATIDGFELEGQWVPADGWSVEAGVGYLDAGYDDVDPATGLTGDEKLSRVPKWTLNASVTKEFSLGSRGTLRPRVDWSYRSKTWFDTFNTPFMVQSGYHLVNASVAWNTDDERYGVSLGVTNLTDEKYLQSVYFQSVLGTINDLHAREREWYLTLKYRY